MAKLNYKRLSYTDMEHVSGVVFSELKKQKGINKIDIRDLAWYRYGRYSTQPLVVFLRDGRIFKIRTRKGKILIEKIK